MLITSSNNTRIKQWTKYHEKKYREKDQCFLVENRHLVEEAIQTKLLDTLILLEGTSFDFDGEIVTVSEEVMHKLKMNVSLPNMMGVCHMKKANRDLGKRILLLDDVQDPGNGGTMIRTAYSFGFDSVIFSNKSVDIYNEKLIRSTQGALFHMNVIRGNLTDFMQLCRKNQIPLIATALKNAKPLSAFEASDSVALIFGNEGAGVSESVLKMADELLYIEMSHFESLNVAIAAGICMYHFRKK